MGVLDSNAQEELAAAPSPASQGVLRLRMEWAGLMALKFVGAFLFVVAGLIGISELMPYCE